MSDVAEDDLPQEATAPIEPRVFFDFSAFDMQAASEQGLRVVLTSPITGDVIRAPSGDFASITVAGPECALFRRAQDLHARELRAETEPMTPNQRTAWQHDRQLRFEHFAKWMSRITIATSGIGFDDRELNPERMREFYIRCPWALNQVTAAGGGQEDMLPFWHAWLESRGSSFLLSSGAFTADPASETKDP